MRRLIFKIKIQLKSYQAIRKERKDNRKRLKKIQQVLLDDIIKAKVRQSVHNLKTVTISFFIESTLDFSFCTEKEFETIITELRDRYGISLSWNDEKRLPKHYTIYLYND